MGNAIGYPTRKESEAFAILSTVASVPSLIGATYIIQHVLRSAKRRNRVFTRIMLFMSIMDGIFALTTFCSAWPVPKELPIYMASGTWTSCEVQGMFKQGSKLASLAYNGFLAVYYLLTINYNWHERQFGRCCLEAILHFAILAVSWGIAIALLVKQMYNPGSTGCQILGFPPGCEFGPEVECTRGINAEKYNFWCFYVPFWLFFAVLVVCMSMIYYRLYQTERRASRYDGTRGLSSTTGSGIGSDSSGTNLSAARIREMRQRFATQALLYCLVYLLTWIFYVTGATLVLTTELSMVKPLAYLAVTFASLQGFFNACIYIRPRYLRYRRRQEQEARRQQTMLGESATTTQQSVEGGGGLAALMQALSVQAIDDEDSFLDVTAGGGNDDNEEKEKGAPQIVNQSNDGDTIHKEEGEDVHNGIESGPRVVREANDGDSNSEEMEDLGCHQSGTPTTEDGVEGNLDLPPQAD